jgi:hypothetical protein
MWHKSHHLTLKDSRDVTRTYVVMTNDLDTVYRLGLRAHTISKVGSASIVFLVFTLRLNF